MICDDLNIAKEICYKRKQEVKGKKEKYNRLLIIKENV